MTVSDPAPIARPSPRPDALLRSSAAAWLAIAMLGQLLFAAYIATNYGASAVRGDIAAWGRTTLKGYVVGDAVGNAIFAGHIVFAVTISVAGAMQLLPALRRRAPAVHRWNGRMFLTSAAVLAVGGLHLVWVREATLGITAAVGVSLNAILVLAFGGLALSAALRRDYAAHGRWAVRTFMVAGGVWFQRLGYMAWVILNQGPVGMTKRLDGPFDTFLSFAAYLLPLAIAELYMRARDQRLSGPKFVMAGVIGVATLLTLLGVGGAAAMMWAPRVVHALTA